MRLLIASCCRGVGDAHIRSLPVLMISGLKCAGQRVDCVEALVDGVDVRGNGERDNGGCASEWREGGGTSRMASTSGVGRSLPGLLDGVLRNCVAGDAQRRTLLTILLAARSHLSPGGGYRRWCHVARARMAALERWLGDGTLERVTLLAMAPFLELMEWSENRALLAMTRSAMR
jgi:hypothetical protein